MLRNPTPLAPLAFALTLSACVTPVGGSLEAACEGTRASRAAVARDVQTAPDIPLVISAANLVLEIDAVCAGGAR